MTSPTKEHSSVHISKKGLTKAGVVVIQTLFISLFTIVEMVFRHGVGLFTGLAICIAAIGTVRFGRDGTAYVSAATTPLAFALITLITLVFQDGLHPSRIGVDFIASLASVAPYLLAGAGYGWFNFFRSKRPHPTR